MAITKKHIDMANKGDVSLFFLVVGLVYVGNISELFHLKVNKRIKRQLV
jgi:hypothetical protein